MRINLNHDLNEQLAAMDERKWSPLQVRLTIKVNNAAIYAFAEVAYDVGDLVSLGLMTKPEAAAMLQQIAASNELIYRYGQDRIQRMIADGLALREGAAA